MNSTDCPCSRVLARRVGVGRVAAALRADGHDVTALTLPGLESTDADRSSITLADHVDAICEAVTAAGPPVVLAVHSGAGAPGYAVTDRIPEQIAAMVYVDTGPARGALDPDFDAVEKPLSTREELAEEENLDGLTEEQLETFRRRAVPEPGAALRDAADERRAPRRAEHGRVHRVHLRAVQKCRQGGLRVCRRPRRAARVSWVDLPTSHWPMWSRPQELAGIIGDIAQGASPV